MLWRIQMAQGSNNVKYFATENEKLDKNWD